MILFLFSILIMLYLIYIYKIKIKRGPDYFLWNRENERSEYIETLTI